MYLWNVDKLVAELKEGRVSERDKLLYLLLNGVGVDIVSDSYFNQSFGYSNVDFANTAVNLLFTVAGTIFIYLKNKAGDNLDLITRCLCLGTPIGFRVFAALVPVLFVSVYFDGISLDEKLAEAGTDENKSVAAYAEYYGISIRDVVLNVLSQILFYGYLGRKISEVSGSAET